MCELNPTSGRIPKGAKIPTLNYKYIYVGKIRGRGILSPGIGI
jgi:hypothetical protein